MEEKFAPKGFSAADDQEDEGILIIRNLLRSNKRVKEILGGNDKTPNRDGFIELRNETHATGKLEAQVKPIDAPRKKKTGKLCYQLPASMIGYSKLAGLPFILICYDRETNKAYWKPVTESLFDGTKQEQESKTIDFLPEDEITESQGYTDAWFDLVNKHLEAIRLASSMRPLVDALKSDKAFGGQLDSPEAIAELLKRIQQLSAEKYKTRLEEAQKLFHQSEIEAALKILQPLVEEMERARGSGELLFDVHIWLGNCRYRTEEFEAAEECFRQALQLDKDSPRAQTNLAHIFYVRNVNKKEALELAKTGYDSRPDNEHSVATYLMCLSFNKQFDEIEKIVGGRKELFDKSSVLQLALGQIEKERQEYAVSCDHFKQATVLDGSNHHARILFAESVYKTVRAAGLESLAQNVVPNVERFGKELDEAISELGKAIEYFTQTTDRQALYRAYDYRACINMLRGRFEVALSDCEKMDAVIPNKEFGKIVRAQIYLQLNRFAEVIDLLSPLTASDRQDVLQALAYSHYRLSHWTEAAPLFTKYIDEDNACDSELFAYVQSLRFSDQKKKAYQVALKLRKAGRAPLVIMREVELARLRELQDWHGSLDVLEDLIKTAPRDPEFYIQRLASYMNMGDRENAVRFYRDFPRELLNGDNWAQQRFNDLEAGLRQQRWI